jgi:manganese/zinc/iron transport system permease protein
MMFDWTTLDTWIAVTAALAAMSCALPGALLVLRRQSLLGDALSHAALPGIVLAYLALHFAEERGWVTRDGALAMRPTVLFAGAAITGISCGVLSELVQRWGRLEPTAALGVVYTTLFAFGLLLIRAVADQAHIDAGCVLYGNLETVVTDTVTSFGLPRAALTSGAVLLVNGLLVVLCFKELQLCTFDADFAQALGYRSGWVHVGVLAATGATVVAAFESVGSILVIAMLIVPPATAVLLSDRLSGVLWWSLAAAGLSAVLGHAAALVVPGFLQQLFRLPQPGEVSTAGMMAVVSGALFLLAWILSPQHGWLRQLIGHLQLQIRILAEDILGVLYRLEELGASMVDGASLASLAETLRAPEWRIWAGVRYLRQKAWIAPQGRGIVLTDTGRDRGRELVRSHRLWEAYLAKHFALPDRSLHAAAEQAEHYLSAPQREELAAELEQPAHDPHGRDIPAEPHT